MDSQPLASGTGAAQRIGMTPTTSSTEEITKKLIRAVETPESRRASPRVTLAAEVNLSSENNFFSGFSTDIAAGGVFIASLTTLGEGTLVALNFTLPDGSEVSANGEVKWIRPFDEGHPEALPGMGIQFVDLSPKAKASIEKFIASREPMFFPD
jgi:uncharacterized protein (TIGR02266 family)